MAARDISIHALLAESDHAPNRRPCPRSISSHALLAESDLGNVVVGSRTSKFLSTLSLRRATKRLRQKLAEAIISIHALLAESDCRVDFFFICCIIISIHALLAESDATWSIIGCPMQKFLSTLSLRRATWTVFLCYHYSFISIHALLAESDNCFKCALGNPRKFLSTLSLRRATR